MAVTVGSMWSLLFEEFIVWRHHLDDFFRDFQYLPTQGFYNSVSLLSALTLSRYTLIRPC